MRSSIRRFGDCLVEVDLGASRMALTIGNVAQALTIVHDRGRGTETGLPRGLRLWRHGMVERRFCAVSLAFVDNHVLQAEAEPVGPGQTATEDQLCGVAEAAARGMQLPLLTRPVGRLAFREGSLGALNACKLAPLEVTRVVGVPGSPSPYLGRHRCRWAGPREDDPSVILLFSVRHVDSAEREQGFPTVIGGRPSVVVELESSSCVAETPHIAMRATPANEVEVAQVYVTADDACARAREVASLIWPELPTG